jgi:hypothetical protein
MFGLVLSGITHHGVNMMESTRESSILIVRYLLEIYIQWHINVDWF